MIDATLSVIMREHAVDESHVINEIKDYLSKNDDASPRNSSLKEFNTPQKKALRSGSFVSLVNAIRSKVKKSAIRLAPKPPNN